MMMKGMKGMKGKGGMEGKGGWGPSWGEDAGKGKGSSSKDNAPYSKGWGVAASEKKVSWVKGAASEKKASWTNGAASETKASSGRESSSTAVVKEELGIFSGTVKSLNQKTGSGF